IDALTAQLDRALGHLAALGAKQARDGLERRRLPRPVGAEQGGDAALADGERHALEDEDDAIVDDFDVVQRQHRIRSRRGPTHPPRLLSTFSVRLCYSSPPPSCT